VTGNVSTTAQDLLQGAAMNINAFSPGQVMPANIASVCMQVGNDLLDSLSTDQAFVYTQTENIVSWTPGQFQYTIGNPVGGTFLGTTTIGSPTINGVTVPGNITLNGDLTDQLGLFPAGTVIESWNAGLNTVTVSNNATNSSGIQDTFTYTTPGNLKMPRPLRFRNGFTRVTTSAASGLDYWFEFGTLDRYNEIGLKSVSGPWPYLAAYQPTFPLGTLWVYPNPQLSGQVFLYTDMILSEFTNLTQPINLPQGYSRALKKLWALELCPIFGKTPSPQLITQAKEAKNLLKSQNASPVITLRYDSDLIYSRHTDAGWIVSGGFL
jgi:hypothetical protein